MWSFLWEEQEEEDRIKNENIRGAAQLRCSGDEGRLRFMVFRGGAVKVLLRGF